MAGEVEYRPIEGYPGYRVGSDGSVWSCVKLKHLGSTYGTKRMLTDEWRELKQRTRKGYKLVCLCMNNQQAEFLVHRLVLEAFVGPCPDGKQAAHNNGNKADNSVDNLRWATPKENMADQYIHGTRIVGDKTAKCKLTPDDVLSIRYAREFGLSYKSLGRLFGVTPQSVFAILKGVTWRHVQ